MFTVSGTSISLTRGDSFYTVLSLKRRSGETYTPAEGDKVRFALKRNLLNYAKTDFKDPEPLILKEIPTDTMLLHLEPSDTKNLAFGSYVYDVEVTFANGDVDTVIADAPFELTKEVY